MSDRIRIEVEDRHGGIITYVPLPDPEDPATQQARQAVLTAVSEAAERAGITRQYAATVLSVLLARQKADIEAYEREAQRRGYLPL